MNAQIEKIEPPFWWEGMKDKSLMITIYGTDISKYSISSDNLNIEKTVVLENPDYLFIYLNLDGINAGTDAYNIDKRFGTNEKYKELSLELKKRGMKLIMDYVLNHWGLNHYMVKNSPSKDWINRWVKYTNTTHNKEIFSDPYASKIDLEESSQGWFTESMPDLNQKQPQFLKYLKQNAIWWIEYADLSGFRVDTYPKNDKNF